MKKMFYKFSTKIMTAVLSFAMVLTGVFSFGAIKKETASADEYTLGPKTFNYTNVHRFAYDMGRNMQLEDVHGVLLVDSELFIETTVAQGTTYEDLEDEAFFVGLAAGLYEQYLNGIHPEMPELPIQEVLELVDIEVFVNLYDTTRYVKLEDGSSFLAGTKNSLFSRVGYNINDNPFYAAILNLPNSHFYNMLYDLQAHPYEVYVFPENEILISEDGDLIVWGWIGASAFTQGSRWIDSSGSGTGEN